MTIDDKTINNLIILAMNTGLTLEQAIEKVKADLLEIVRSTFKHCENCNTVNTDYTTVRIDNIEYDYCFNCTNESIINGEFPQIIKGVN